MPIGGGGLNGNQNNPGFNSVGTNPSLAGPSAVTPTATASNFSSGGSTATPGLGGTTPTAIRPTATASNFAPTPGVGGTGQSNTAFNNTGSGEQAPISMTGKPTPSTTPNYIPGTPGTFNPSVAGTHTGNAGITLANNGLAPGDYIVPGSIRDQNPANQAAWDAQARNNPLITPDFARQQANIDASGNGTAKSLANPNGGFAQSQPQNSQYGQNQLMFLLNTLSHYGLGQNQFGNSFSPTFTGQGTQGGLSQASSGTNSGGLSLQQLLPILMGLAQNGQGQGPAPGSYGNLGNSANSYTPDPYYQPGGQGYAKGYTQQRDPYYLPGGQGFKLGYKDPNFPNG